MSYYVTDPTLQNSLPPFQSSKSYLNPLYELLNSDGSAYDSNLITFDPVSLSFKVESSNEGDVGTYDLMLKSYYSQSNSYSVKSNFLVTVIPNCMRSLITA